MIKYNLKCKCGESFESWFSSSSEFDSLKKSNLVNCIFCNSHHVDKDIMSPNLPGKSNKKTTTKNLDSNIKLELSKLRRFIEKNCKNVGENFPQEARSIHYDKKTSKGIYGKATPEETAELLEEGIDVTTVPWVDKSDN